MRRRYYFVATMAILVFAGLAVVRGQGQQLRYVRGTVKSISSDSIVLTSARDLTNPAAPAADMTLVIAAQTRFVNRQLIQENSTVMIGYVEQSGKLIASNVAFMGFSNGAAPFNPVARQPGQNPYNTPVPIPPTPGAPTRSQGGQPLPARPGGCQYSAGPCVANPEPEPKLLPADTPHDFNSVRRQADAAAREYAGAKIYNIELNYMNDAIWQAEFDYAAEPSGKRR